MTRSGPRRCFLPVVVAIAMLTFTLPAIVAAPSGLDEASAATWVLDAQWTDEGLSTEFPEQVVFPRASHLAIERLSAEGAVDRVDAPAAAQAAGRVQVTGGGFLHSTGDILGPWTGATAHGVLLAQTHDVDIDEEAAAGFLADHQGQDGTYQSSSHAAHVTLGLAAADALEQIDEDATASYLEASQTERGGLALRVFYIEDTAMSRHATALQAHAILAGTCPQPEPAQQNPGATHQPVACPGQ